MSSSSSLTGLRGRNHQSSSGDPSSGYATPTRFGGNYMPTHSQTISTADRNVLQRRSTNEMGKAVNLAPIGQQPMSAHQSNQVNRTAQTIDGVVYPLSVSAPSRFNVACDL